LNQDNIIYIDCPDQINGALILCRELKNVLIVSTDPRTVLELEQQGVDVERLENHYKEADLNRIVENWQPEIWELFRKIDKELAEHYPLIKSNGLKPVERSGSAIMLKIANHAAAIYICQTFMDKFKDARLFLPDMAEYGPIYSVFENISDCNRHYVWAFDNIYKKKEWYRWVNEKTGVTPPFKSLLNEKRKNIVYRFASRIKTSFSRRKKLLLHLDYGQLSERIKEMKRYNHISIEILFSDIQTTDGFEKQQKYREKKNDLWIMDVEFGHLIENDIQYIIDHFLFELKALDEWVNSNPKKFTKFCGVICNQSLYNPQLAIIAEYLTSRGLTLFHYQHGGGYGAQHIPKFIKTDFACIENNHIFCVWGEAVKAYSQTLKPPVVNCIAIGWKSLNDKIRKPSDQIDKVIYVPGNMRYESGGLRPLPYGDYPCTSYYEMQKRIVDAIAPNTVHPFTVKLHPNAKRPTPIEMYAKKRGYEVIFANDKLKERIDDSTLIVTDHPSTTYCEALALGCTVMLFQDQVALKAMEDAMVLMEESSYVHTDFDGFIEAVRNAVENPDGIKPKNNLTYLKNYVFNENGDSELRKIITMSDCGEASWQKF